MEELADKIRSLLSDPEGVEKIMGVARSLGADKPQPSPDQPSSAPSGGAEPLNQLLENPELRRLFGAEGKKRTQLLRAISPYLGEDRRRRLDRIIKATSAFEMLYGAKGLL